MNPLWFGVWGLGFGFEVLGFGLVVWGLGFGVWGLVLGVLGFGFGVEGLGFGVQGSGSGLLFCRFRVSSELFEIRSGDRGTQKNKFVLVTCYGLGERSRHQIHLEDSMKTFDGRENHLDLSRFF